MRRPTVLRQTPAALGYAFPAEWAPHAGTWFSWPRPEGISFPGKYEPVPANLARIMREIIPREEVHINVPGPNDERDVRERLARHGVDRNVFFHHIATNECWCRDHGPAFVLRQEEGGRAEAAVVDWGFNAWGGKYPPWEADDAVPTAVASELGLPVFEPGIVMEGGAVDFNGEGTVLTTTSCLLNPNRNPGLTQQEVERYLRDYYGQRHVVWLGDGIVGDDTDGHIDDLARFIDARTVAIGIEEDPSDDNYAVLRDNLARLRAARDQDGRRFEVVTVPMPPPVHHEGQRLPATYMNFYFVNAALLVPTYRHAARDAAALEILQRRLPGHRVIGIDCVDLIWGLGAIHCLTQQQPKF
jgi:agmatine deiminase